MKQFFCNAELSFEGVAAWNPILEIHQVSELDAGPYSVEVRFDSDGTALQGRILGADLPDSHPWAAKIQREISEGRLRPLDKAPNDLWCSELGEGGTSRLGGPPPPGFSPPESVFASGYGYVGSLSAKDPAFRLLRKDVHLIWPFFLDYHSPLFLDVSNPLRPVKIDAQKCYLFDAGSGKPVAVASEDRGPEVLESDTILEMFHDRPARPEFEAAPFSMKLVTGTESVDTDLYDAGVQQIVSAGVPIWVQYPEVPLDPQNNQPMAFLCQLSGGPKLVDVSARPDPDSYLASSFDRMDFWGDGVLFVFISADGERLCLLAQNT